METKEIKLTSGLTVEIRTKLTWEERRRGWNETKYSRNIDGTETIERPFDAIVIWVEMGLVGFPHNKDMFKMNGQYVSKETMNELGQDEIREISDHVKITTSLTSQLKKK